MPLDLSIKKVLVIGSGPIIIGQSCEFDYSGVQACKALKEEGCQVVLLNSNPATIMTDGSIADSVYIEPITLPILEKILEKERPDSLLATMGGQTALNCAREMIRAGLLEKYGVRLLGLTLSTIEKAENRELFRAEMEKIGLETPRSFSVTESKLPFPLIVRSSFTLGGLGGGIAHNREELDLFYKAGFSSPKELLIEESLIGWKEYELEVMRDPKGNCIVICGIENVDPLGVHTGDSITVTPLQTLTDKEYQLMRKRAFQVLEAIGMVCGGCNVQFAVNPLTGRMLCIEVNPRVSRSSALASKATGFPIAKISTKLSLGYLLDELKKEGDPSSLPACFEPVIDYVVTKIPRFNFDKFPQADSTLSTHMKSVGEVMAIGSTFKESLGKALSSLEGDYPEKLQVVCQALRQGTSLEQIHQLTGYDPWFLGQINELIQEEKKIAKTKLQEVDFALMHRWKKRGFSDEKLAILLQCKELQIAEMRKHLKVHPIYKRIDSCSGEFLTKSSCLYSTYEEECESHPSSRKKILILGSGPNRIGQGIEFDYCCVHAAEAAGKLGYESILINCNPGTVSTDPDSTDKLYFEPITVEHVREVIRVEKPLGILIQFGGQTPLNIGKILQEEGLHLLGTPFASIDIAEDRMKWRLFAKQLGLKQPQNGVFSSSQEALEIATDLGFPLIVRPSYIIGGNEIQILHNLDELKTYLQKTPIQSTGPLLIEKFLEGAIEIEIDAIADGNEVFICGIMQQIEPVGIHSGDSMSFLSPFQIDDKIQQSLIEQTRVIGLSLHIKGLFNIQFALYQEEILVLEVNPRASRTIPLLSKTTGISFVQIATLCILGQSLQELGYQGLATAHLLGLKLPIFPFSRLRIEDFKLGPQMQSTGEVLCLAKSFSELFEKAQLYAEEYKEVSALLPRSDRSLEIEIYNINKSQFHKIF